MSWDRLKFYNGDHTTQLQALRALSACVMGAAICGMHYTAALAGRYKYDKNATDGKNSLLLVLLF